MPNGGRVDAIGDDFTDLDSILEQDGRYTPGSNLHYNNSNNINSSNGNNHGYRISFQSVDDDELHRLMRALVTPVPHRYSSGSPCSTENIDWRLKRHDDTASQASDSSSSRNPNNNRSESVMLFKKINDGDEDVSFDLVASDLNDFIDPVMLEGIMSRPASRAPRSTTPGQQQLRQQPPLTPTIPER
ncbi:hypothetical protein BDB00DRAFT_68752 [Zychaea mexicana]|uniref:uncharacterized protein n=1 Tax=Zychaea mexicana TaxID=64656 RepID=UPI0022FE7899|nr:uncharacterized protein BDB00DRAFT_68752 [Zychaea mexicana]KAI9488060.1 hypothetical protein BDB00DRAFT_68752 [Zychaea mexicana]